MTTTLAVQICLRRQVFPASLEFLLTGAAIVLTTCVPCVSNGPRSPLVYAARRAAEAGRNS